MLRATSHLEPTVSLSAFFACATVNPISANTVIWSAEGSGTLDPDMGSIGSSISEIAQMGNLVLLDNNPNANSFSPGSHSPGSSICSNSHVIAGSAPWFPVLISALWHRTRGNPICSSCSSAAASTCGSLGSEPITPNNSHEKKLEVKFL